MRAKYILALEYVMFKPITAIRDIILKHETN